ncbi:hypothetical protein ACLOJK_009301 [Asimina triloba]
MNASRPTVHPVEAPPLITDGAANEAPRVRMKDIQGMPGTAGGLVLRLCQFVFAALALGVMASTSDFTSVTAFCISKSHIELIFSDAVVDSAVRMEGRKIHGLLDMIVGRYMVAAALDVADMDNSAAVFSSASEIVVDYLVAAVALQSLWSLSLAIVDIYALLVKRSLRNSRVVSFFTIGDGITSTLTFAAACASAGITVLLGNDLGVCGQNPCTEFETATAMAFISWFTISLSFLFNFWSLASR